MLKRLNFEVEEYQDQDGREILTEVTRRINKCDYFIGIWHHEEGSHTTVSPWMPFEYGVAMALGKGCYVVCSASLPLTVRNRINPATANPTYSDARFFDETLAKIETYCRLHFTRSAAGNG
jgi:hypothetical protein